jgi:predicted dehydrogenase
MKQRVKIALVGYGYWGNNLLRNLTTHPGCQVVGVCEASQAKLDKAFAQYPHVAGFKSIAELMAKALPEAVVIATPPASHCELAVAALRGGAHVLLEKPMATSSEECDLILAEAKKAGKTVMVDHTFVYYSPVQYLSDLIHKGDLGTLLYYDSVRVNLGGFQPEVNVLWDLAPHDLSILDLFTKEETPEQVIAIGVKHFGSSTENMCYLNLKYKNDFNAHLHLNWAAPVKVRTITLGGDKQMVVFDDNMPTEKVRIYDKSIQLKSSSPADFMINYRVGNMVAPVVLQKEALFEMLTEFVTCVRDGKKPRSDGYSGARVVRILEAAARSLAAGGVPEKIRSLTGISAKTAKMA